MRYLFNRARWAWPFITVAIGTAIRLALDPWLGVAIPYGIFFLAIAVTAQLAGFLPAALATMLSALSAAWLFIPPPDSLWIHNPQDVGAIILFVAVGLAVSFLGYSMQKARASAEAASEKSRQAHERLQEIVGLLDLANVVARDHNDRVTRWNKGAEYLFGFTADEALGRVVHDLLRTTFPEPLERIRAALFASGRWEGELVHVRRDGARLAVYSVWVLHRDAAGEVTGILEMSTDISQRKAVEKQLHLQAAALEAAANGIVLTDSQGTILWVNPAFSRMTGYFAQEAIGGNPRVLKSGKQDDAFYRRMWETVCRGEVWHGELVNRRKDGSLYTEEMTISPVRDEEGRIAHFIAIKQDVSERKRAEEAVAAAKVSAEHANAAKDHFLAVLSHELRTPLTPVLAAVSIIERKELLSAELRHTLEIIRRNVTLEARLIDDLLDLTRIVRGKVALERKVVDVASVLARVVEVCKPDIDARRLDFGVDIKGGPHRVDADPARLQQVFWNLLKNSIKFTPEGGCVGMRCYGEDGTIVVEVNDSGIGIAPDSLQRIFNAFEQADQRVTRQFGGLGLGLAITKRLIEMHEGTITAHSEGVGKGATFCVVLPRSREAFDQSAPKPIAAGAAAEIGAARYVLLVEDHGDTAQLMRTLLESAGFVVETAGDVAQALDAVSRREFDLLISDLGLPDRSGLELMQELRRNKSNLKGIALSGFGREEDVRKSKEAGFTEHLTKPVDFDALITVVERVTQTP